MLTSTDSVFLFQVNDLVSQKFRKRHWSLLHSWNHESWHMPCPNSRRLHSLRYYCSCWSASRPLTVEGNQLTPLLMLTCCSCCLPHSPPDSSRWAINKKSTGASIWTNRNHQAILEFASQHPRLYSILVHYAEVCFGHHKLWWSCKRPFRGHPWTFWNNDDLAVCTPSIYRVFSSLLCYQDWGWCSSALRVDADSVAAFISIHSSLVRAYWAVGWGKG